LIFACLTFACSTFVCSTFAYSTFACLLASSHRCPTQESTINPRFEGTRHIEGEPVPVIKANPNRKKVVKREPGRRLVTKRYIKAQLKKELKQVERPQRIKLSKRHERRHKAGRYYLPPVEERPETLLSNPEIRHELKRRVRRIFRQRKAEAKLAQPEVVKPKRR